MSLRLGGDGAITGCTSLAEPALTLSGLTVSGQIFTVSGTTAAPGIAFVDDNDTGIYSPAANQVAITTSATERLKVDDTGKVGIGTNSPATILHTFGGYPTVKVENNNTAQFASASIDLQGPASDERITKILHGNSNTGGTETYFKIEQYDSNGAFVKTLSNYDYQFDFWSFNTAGSEKIRIDSSGAVGIGTSSPSTKLTINHTTPIDTTNSAIAGELGNIYLEMSSGGTQGNGNLGPSINFTGINQSGIDGRKAAIIAQQTGANSSQVGLSFWTNNTTDSGGVIQNRMVVGANGLVGIGTSSPSKTLDVNGEIRASTGILFGTDTAADNTLDDYEEGTWTPTYLASSTNPTVTYTFQQGVYTKIGNIVHCQGRLETSAASGGNGSLLIGNFPFTAKSGNDRGVINIGFSSNWATQAPETGHMATGGNNAFLRYFDGAATTTITASNLNNVSSNDNDIIFDVTYEVA